MTLSPCNHWHGHLAVTNQACGHEGTPKAPYFCFYSCFWIKNRYCRDLHWMFPWHIQSNMFWEVQKTIGTCGEMNWSVLGTMSRQGRLAPSSFRAVIRRAVCGKSAKQHRLCCHRIAHPPARCCACSVVHGAHPVLHAAAEAQPPLHCYLWKTVPSHLPVMYLLWLPGAGRTCSLVRWEEKEYISMICYCLI